MTQLDSTKQKQRAKVAVLASAICFFSVMNMTFPAMAAKHGIHVVYIVLPIVAIQVIAFAYLLLAARELKSLA